MPLTPQKQAQQQLKRRYTLNETKRKAQEYDLLLTKYLELEKMNAELVRNFVDIKKECDEALQASDHKINDSCDAVKIKSEIDLSDIDETKKESEEWAQTPKNEITVSYNAVRMKCESSLANAQDI